MADAKSQPEPSMEEILASIRRIISEEEQPEAQVAKTITAPQPVASAQSAAPVAPTRAAPAARVPEAKPTDDEVLDLTDRVAEDGTVVNLRGEGNAARPANSETAHPASAQAEDIELRDVVPSGGRAAARMVEEAPHGGRASARMVEEAPRDPRQLGTLVSDAAAAATTASFAALARAVDQEGTGDPISVGGRTLEDIVKEIMRPMIRDWLDANLPGLVERLVRREIELISHKAQDG